ncbi:MAG TPA: N-acetyltransferase, partial [Clostridia bacterium]|nr:N-acetyltransferase [Clostridia bacterium]
MKATVEEVTTRRGLREFVEFPYRLYRGHRGWVPVLRSEMTAIVTGHAGFVLKDNPHAFFVARDDRGRVSGRVGVLVDTRLSAAKGVQYGAFTLFDMVDDWDQAKALLDAGTSWLRSRGMQVVKGPVSPTNGDDYHGMLAENFEDPPMMYTNYNHPYYNSFVERYGFTVDVRLGAWRFDVRAVDGEREKLVQKVMTRNHYHVDNADMGNLEGTALDIKRILDEAMPAEWADLTPPSIEDVRIMVRDMKKFVRPEMVAIARTDEGRPIGLVAASPDYNQVFRRMNGRLLPFGWLTFLLYRGRIDAGRALVMFVVPDYRFRGVPAAMFSKLFAWGRTHGYRLAEGSLIGEENVRSWREIEGAGGVRY